MDRNPPKAERRRDYGTVHISTINTVLDGMHVLKTVSPASMTTVVPPTGPLYKTCGDSHRRKERSGACSPQTLPSVPGRLLTVPWNGCLLCQRWCMGTPQLERLDRVVYRIPFKHSSKNVDVHRFGMTEVCYCGHRLILASRMKSLRAGSRPRSRNRLMNQVGHVAPMLRRNILLHHTVLYSRKVSVHDTRIAMDA